MLKFCTVLLTVATVVYGERRVDYTGHKVLSVIPKTEGEVELLLKLQSDYGVDLWNVPKVLGVAIMIRLPPEIVTSVEETLHKLDIKYETVFEDLQSIIVAEHTMHASSNLSHAEEFDFGKYNEYESVVKLLKSLRNKYPKVAKLNKIGKTYEKRSIYNLVIGESPRKKTIMIECGIHAREWSSVAACSYLVNQLVTGYGTDPAVTSLVDKYEFNVVVESNPDGYIYTWNVDRLWRKTRSRSILGVIVNCEGVDANRNWGIEHCGRGSSRNPCDETYCGNEPFSESETQALRDLLISLKDRMKGYFSIHAFSQLWMTPYGTTKALPPNYNELVRVATIGAEALERRYGTQYKVGSIANVIYAATGSSNDYAYIKQRIKMVFTLEVRDTGRYGFFLPQIQILPMCEETYDGLVAAIQAI